MNYDLDNILLGAKLRDFRLKANMTLSQAAENAGVSPAFISMVENGKCGITFSKIHTLLNIYGKNFSDLSDLPPANPDVVNVAEANLVASENGIRILGLAKSRDDSDSHVGGLYIYFEPGAYNQFDYHPGTDFIMVIEGTFELTLHSIENGNDVYKTHRLSAGDTMVYSSSLGHEYKNVGEGIGKILFVETNTKN